MQAIMQKAPAQNPDMTQEPGNTPHLAEVLRIDKSLLHGYSASSGERVLVHKCHLGMIDYTCV